MVDAKADEDVDIGNSDVSEEGVEHDLETSTDPDDEPLPTAAKKVAGPKSYEDQGSINGGSCS
jgi:hypothetical protein